MKKNGGFATLGFLYQNVDVTNWKTKTPFRSINRIVQDDRFFFRIKPGLWALNEMREHVLQNFEISFPKAKDTEEFSHSYFQGLIVEIGNMMGYNTFVPNQDKNKLFLNKCLKNIVTLEKIYAFGYEHFVKRAGTVDVTWFNDNNMPAHLYEVEHSTDIQNSLIKFCELMDFNIQFHIVADNNREKEFSAKLSKPIFKEIKYRVKFINYNFVSEKHSYLSRNFHYEKQFI